MKRVWKIDVPIFDNGYSFAIKSDDETPADAIENARKNDLFAVWRASTSSLLTC